MDRQERGPDQPEESNIPGADTQPSTPLLLTRKALTRVSSFPAVDRRPAPRAVPSSERTKHQPGQPPVRLLHGASQLLQASVGAWCVPDFHPDGT